MLDSRYFVKGHLTAEAFQWLDTGETDVLVRERMLTHLDDCPACMDHYLEVLTEETLLEPPEGMEERILYCIHEDYSRRKKGKIIFVKATKLTVAVCLTMVLFAGGVFDFLRNAPKMAESRPRQSEQLLSVQKDSQRKEDRRNWLEEWNSDFIGFAKSLNTFTLIGDGNNGRK